MFRNYLTIAFRNFSRQKGFSLINILGLALGLASATVIFLYIIDETGYDQFHPNSDHIYVLGTEAKFNGEEQTFDAAPGAWLGAVKQRYPEVTEGIHSMRVGYPASFRDPSTDKIILTEKELWVSPDFSKVLHLTLRQGNGETVFKQLNSLVISTSAARRFFGDQDPVGKTLEVRHIWVTQNEYLPLIITGVMEDYPGNSHLQPEFLMNLEMLRSRAMSTGQNWYANWGNGPGWFSTYICLQDNADIDKITHTFNKVVQSNLKKDANSSVKPFLLPLKDLHFNEKLRSSFLSSGDIRYVYIFGSIAVLIIIIASINYMNLATARAFRRAKEIGLRKVVGSDRLQLIIQFLSESLITTTLALLLAIILVIFLLPVFNTLSGKHFTIWNLLQGELILALVGSTLLVALLAGSYPALYLSRFKPIDVLKNTRNTGRGSDALRKGLIVLQYTITLALIICTGVMMKQMAFIRQSTLSQNGDQMLSIRFGSGMSSLDKYKAFKRLVQQDPELTQVTLANHLPRQDFFGSIDTKINFPEISSEIRNWFVLNGDYDFPSTFGLELVAGRYFDATNRADSNAFLLNESAVKTLGLKADKVIGMSIISNNENWEQKITGRVIGVVRDFSYRSIHQSIAPLVVSARPHSSDQIIYVKLPAGKMPEKIASLEKKWLEVLADIGFDHWFISEEFGRMYEVETRMAGLFKTFSVLAILIACLGLFGLSSYMAQRRTKEISVRKVLGASVPQILRLLFVTFIKLLVISCFIAIPLAWFMMHKWLQDFTYRIEVDGFIFVIGIIMVLLLTVASVSYETMRAALANPIHTLRQE